jgi:hypothetical protein
MVGKLTPLGGSNAYVANVYLQVKFFLLPIHFNYSIICITKLVVLQIRC